MPTRLPIFRYAVLGLLLAITIAYEVPYLRDILRDEKRDVAVFSTDSGTNTISFVSEKARKAGIHKGDEILAVNGEPYNGVSDWFEAARNTPIGGKVEVEIRSTDPGRSGIHTITLPVKSARPGFWEVLADIVLQFLLPGASVLLGFWVAFLRPRDPMAWLLFLLMLTFPHALESYKVQGWPPGWREAGMLYHATLSGMLPVVMFLFGRFFPTPFPEGGRLNQIWKAQQWLLAVPFAIYALFGVSIGVADLGHYHSVLRLEQATQPLDTPFRICAYILIGSFFTALGLKYGMTHSADAKRRLRFLLAGSTVAWTPPLLVTLYALARGKSIAEVFPQWLIVVLLVPLVLFPLTLAYVIVVQKAMDVRVAVRQGLQYAFAKTGVRVLQRGMVALVIILAISMVNGTNRGRAERAVVILLAIAAVLTIRRGGEWLRRWTDRRFFREAYDAEQVLTDLSDQVRSIVEPKSLLETVASRISQTLHVPRVAVLLGGELYKPAYAVGYGDLSDMTFAPSAGTVQHLQKQKEPARVYLQNQDSWLYRDQDVDDVERAQLAKLGSELLLPLATRDRLLGFISLGPKRSEEPYTGSDVRLLKSVAAQTGLALENADLMRKISDEVAHRERLNREVEIAREVQERLFPQKLPEIAGLDYAGNCRPALGVGGDYYDFLALPQGHLGVAIGDVSGKGIAAALMMASLQASLRGEATRAPENLAAAVANVNRLVFEASAENRYATFFYGQYDPETRRFDYVNAGHNPPMLFRCVNGKWTVTRLEVGGTVVGLLESFPYQQGTITASVGDVLVAFTDGISEAMNLSDEEWGEERLIQSVERCSGLPAKEVLEHIFQDADAFVSGAKQHDDMTLVVLRAVDDHR